MSFIGLIRRITEPGKVSGVAEVLTFLLGNFYTPRSGPLFPYVLFAACMASVYGLECAPIMVSVWGFLVILLDVCRWHTELRGVSTALDLRISSYEQRSMLWWASGLACSLLFCGSAYSLATAGRWPRSVLRSWNSAIRSGLYVFAVSLDDTMTPVLVNGYFAAVATLGFFKKMIQVVTVAGCLLLGFCLLLPTHMLDVLAGNFEPSEYPARPRRRADKHRQVRAKHTDRPSGSSRRSKPLPVKEEQDDRPSRHPTRNHKPRPTGDPSVPQPVVLKVDRRTELISIREDVFHGRLSDHKANHQRRLIDRMALIQEVNAEHRLTSTAPILSPFRAFTSTIRVPDSPLSPDDGDDRTQSPVPLLASPVRPSTFQVFDLSSSAPGDEDDRNVLSSPPDDGDDRTQSPVPFLASPVRPSTFQVFDLSSSAPGDEDDRNVLSLPDDGDDRMQSPVPFLASPVRPSTFQVFDLSSSAPGDEDDWNMLSSPPDDGDDRMQSPVPFSAFPVRPSTFQVFDLSSSAPGDEDDWNMSSSPLDDGDDRMQSPVPFPASPVRPSTFQVFDLSSSAPGDEDDWNMLSSPPELAPSPIRAFPSPPTPGSPIDAAIQLPSVPSFGLFYLPASPSQAQEVDDISMSDISMPDWDESDQSTGGVEESLTAIDMLTVAMAGLSVASVDDNSILDVTMADASLLEEDATPSVQQPSEEGEPARPSDAAEPTPVEPTEQSPEQVLALQTEVMDYTDEPVEAPWREMVDYTPETGNPGPSPECEISREEPQACTTAIATHIPCSEIDMVEPQRISSLEIATVQPEQQATETAVAGTPQQLVHAPSIAMVFAPEQQGMEDASTSEPGEPVEDHQTTTTEPVPQQQTAAVEQAPVMEPAVAVVERELAESEDVAESSVGNVEVLAEDDDPPSSPLSGLSSALPSPSLAYAMLHAPNQPEEIRAALEAEEAEEGQTEWEGVLDFDEDYFTSELDRVLDDPSPAPTGLAATAPLPEGLVLPQWSDSEGESNRSLHLAWDVPTSGAEASAPEQESNRWSLLGYGRSESDHFDGGESEEAPPGTWSFLSVDPVQLTADYLATHPPQPTQPTENSTVATTDQSLGVIDPLLLGSTPPSRAIADTSPDAAEPPKSIVYESSDSSDSEPAAKPGSRPRKILPLRKSRVSKDTGNSGPSPGEGPSRRILPLRKSRVAKDKGTDNSGGAVTQGEP